MTDEKLQINFISLRLIKNYSYSIWLYSIVDPFGNVRVIHEHTDCHTQSVEVQSAVARFLCERHGKIYENLNQVQRDDHWLPYSNRCQGLTLTTALPADYFTASPLPLKLRIHYGLFIAPPLPIRLPHASRIGSDRVNGIEQWFHIMSIWDPHQGVTEPVFSILSQGVGHVNELRLFGQIGEIQSIFSDMKHACSYETRSSNETRYVGRCR